MTPCPTERRVVNKAVNVAPQPGVATDGIVLTLAVSNPVIKFVVTLAKSASYLVLFK